MVIYSELAPEFTFFQALASLSGVAGLFSVYWALKNSKPKIKVIPYQLTYESSNKRTKVLLISAFNYGNVPVKLESYGLIISKGFTKEDKLITAKKLISGERYDHYYFFDDILQEGGLVRRYQDHIRSHHHTTITKEKAIKIRAFYRDQVGRLYKSSPFKIKGNLHTEDLAGIMWTDPLDDEYYDMKPWWYADSKFMLKVRLLRPWYRIKQRWRTLKSKRSHKRTPKYPR